MSLIIMTILLQKRLRCISNVGDLYTSAWLTLTWQLRLILGEFPECGGGWEGVIEAHSLQWHRSFFNHCTCTLTN